MESIKPNRVRFAAPLILAIAVLYLTIWPHELGHSVVAYLWGCKQNWWQTNMSWFLWNSRGGGDYTCLATRGAPALLLTDGAGIVVNLVLLSAALFLARWCGPERYRWLFIGSVFWAWANYSEAFSYLVLNTLWLKSDMETIVRQSGISRWAWLMFGLVAAGVWGRGLKEPTQRAAELLQSARWSRRAWLWVFALYSIAISLTMAAARITLM